MATFVLVHGSFQGGWIWQHVANRMRAAGHQVYAPSLDSGGESKTRFVLDAVVEGQRHLVPPRA